jgi:hypothetical protein
MQMITDYSASQNLDVIFLQVLQTGNLLFCEAERNPSLSVQSVSSVCLYYLWAHGSALAGQALRFFNFQ